MSPPNASTATVSRCAIVALLGSLAAACSTVHAATPAAGAPAADADPPLSAIAPEPEPIPTPIAAWETLGLAERLIVSEYLLARARTLTTEPMQLHETATGLELCVASGAVGIANTLHADLSHPGDLIVTPDCRDLIPLSRIGPNELRAEFLARDAIDLDRVWAALLAAFPQTCEVEVDSGAPNNAQSDPLSRSADTLPRALPVTSAFRGIVIKEQRRLSLQDRSKRDGGVPGQGMYLALQTNLYWRRAASRTWNKVSTVKQLIPGMIDAPARNSHELCAQHLLQKVVK